MNENVGKFVDAFNKSIADQTFIKLSLGNYKGSEESLQKIRIRLVETKKGELLSAVFRYEKRDITRNFTPAEMAEFLAANLGREFRSGQLFTVGADVQFEASKKGNSRILTSRSSAAEPPSRAHNRQKKGSIDPSSGYLRALGITTADGKVRDKQQGKWRQINKFVEVVDGLFKRSALKGRGSLRIVDMGSGKGYLTFAVYDHFKNGRGLDVSVTGVEARRELIQLCNRVAAENGFVGLNFEQGSITEFELPETDILIALHACDTATDDAVYKGVSARAEIIIAAPCCHQELRPQIEWPGEFRGIFKHGIMREEMAEMVTDSLRALLLERNGYETKVFDFVPIEHTPKNNMIVGVKRSSGRAAVRVEQEIAALKTAFGIREQRLEMLLA